MNDLGELFDAPACRNHFELFRWARDCGLNNVHQLAVLTALCLRVDLKTMSCNPSVAQIMADTKLGRTAVFNALAQLVSGGALERKTGKGRRVSSTYRPLFGAAFQNVRNTDLKKRPHDEPIPRKTSVIRTKKVRITDTEELPLKKVPPQPPKGLFEEGVEEDTLTREEIQARTIPTEDEIIADPIRGLWKAGATHSKLHGLFGRENSGAQRFTLESWERAYLTDRMTRGFRTPKGDDLDRMSIIAGDVATFAKWVKDRPEDFGLELRPECKPKPVLDFRDPPPDHVEVITRMGIRFPDRPWNQWPDETKEEIWNYYHHGTHASQLTA